MSAVKANRHWRDRLTDREIGICRQAMAAAVDGPFFEEWEFHTLFGLERDEMRAVLADWPSSDNDQRQRQVVISALNNLIGYPHGVRGAAWSVWVSVDEDDLKILLGSVKEGVRE